MFFEKEYAAGRVRAMRSKLLGKETLQETEDAKSVSDMLLTIAGTHYEHAFAKRNLEKSERELFAHKAKSIEKVLSFMPQAYYDAFLVFSFEIDAKNLKRCAHGFSGGMCWDIIKQDLEQTGLVFKKTNNIHINDFDMLCSVLRETVWNAPLKKCREYQTSEHNMSLIAREIDLFVFSRALESENYSIKRFFIEKRDLLDFRLIMLSKNAGLPVPENLLFSPENKESIIQKYHHFEENRIEKDIENHLLSLSRGLLEKEPFSSGLFIDFLCRKEFEAHHLSRSARNACAKTSSAALEAII